jgi:membrane fusion protein, multidrug efflux system
MTRSIHAHARGRPPNGRHPRSGRSRRRRRVAARRRITWLAASTALLVVVIFLGYREGHGAAPRTQPTTEVTPVTVAQSTRGDSNLYLNALGTVTPLATVSIYSQVTGQVLRVHYREGQMVHQGDALIDVDPRPYEALLQQAQGSLQHDQGLLAQARIDLQRYQAAYARNAIARQQLDDQEQAVVQYTGAVKADEGTVAYNRVQLAYCHIVAPVSGLVGLRLVDPGNTVFSGSSSTLLVITQLQPISVVFNIAEDDLAQVQAQLRGGAQLHVDAFDRSDQHLLESGNFTALDNLVDTTTGTVRYRAEFANSALVLFPNQFVNARLLVRTLTNVTLIPTVAVQYNSTNAFVYVVRSDRTVSIQAVTVLTSDAEQSAVQGLNPGVSVATSGFDRLENGAHVSLQPAPRSPSSGASSAPAAAS